MYAQKLVSLYGGGILDELQSLADASKGKKANRIELIEIISLYSEKLNHKNRVANTEIIYVGELTVINPFGTVKEEVNA